LKKWKAKGFNNKDNLEFEINKGKGNIKKYNYLGQLKFEGEYLNRERNGKGKEYNINGELKFEGEYLNGRSYNGKGKDYYNGELEFLKVNI